jgi:transposase
MEKQKIESMPVVNSRAAGIDVGSRSHWVAIGQQKEDVREFSAYTEGLECLCKWLKECGIQTVAMESTGNYWKALYILLQGCGFEVLLVNGKFTKNVKGKKTDILDCQWIQKLHALGLLEGSFIPDNDTQQLRQYCRHRQSLIEDAASYIKKIQQSLRQTNIRLDNALSDVTGASGRAIIEAILQGHRDPDYLASLVNYRVRTPKDELIKALTGDWREEYLFELKQSYEIYKHFREKIEECEKQIERILQQRINQKQMQGENDAPLPKIKRKKYNKNDPRIDLQNLSLQLTGGVDISAIEGIGANAILTVLSEVGIDFSKFPSAKHFTSWLRLAPNKKVTGGKVFSSKTPKGSNRLADALRHAAVAIGFNLKTGALHHFFQRIVFKKGKLAAITATARKLAVIIWNMMTRKTDYAYIKDEDYFLRIRSKQVKAMKRKIQILNVLPAELGLQIVP